MGSKVSVRHFRDYCGECAHYEPCKDERLQGHGLCEYDDQPQGVVSFAYYLTDVARDATEPACVLFERVVAVADRREFIGTYECVGGTTYAADYRWAILGEAEEVVRCRDCRWYAHLRMMCRRADFTVLEPDGYCKWGERK